MLKRDLSYDLFSREPNKWRDYLAYQGPKSHPLPLLHPRPNIPMITLTNPTPPSSPPPR